MTKGIFTILAVVVFCVASNVAVANDSAPNQDTLAAMGLSGMQVLSDSDALDIRGKGYFHKPASQVQIWGSSNANVSKWGGSAESKNGYKASGKHFAEGSNHSYAGMSSKEKSIWGFGHHLKFHATYKSVEFNAGGGSAAKAF
jgi:hypothetical protein